MNVECGIIDFWKYSTAVGVKVSPVLFYSKVLHMSYMTDQKILFWKKKQSVTIYQLGY